MDTASLLCFLLTAFMAITSVLSQTCGPVFTLDGSQIYNKRLDSATFKTITSNMYVIHQCGEYCQRYSRCNSVNFNPVTNECELNEVPTSETFVDVDGDWQFAYKTLWSAAEMLEEPCNSHSCPDDTGCYGDVSGVHRCIPYTP